MIRCDALIVGGGPAGLAAAIALRQKGLDVVVADALHPPIDKACGEGLMPDAQKEITALGIALNEEDGAFFEGITFLCGERRATAHFAQGLGIGIRRLRLHRRLLERCEQVGVRMAWGCHVSMEHRGLSLDGKGCVYRYAVGADGQCSHVRRVLGLGEGKVLSRRFGARCHYRVRPWSRMVEVHWGALGQAYVTPIGPEEVGVATVARSSACGMDEVLASLPALRSLLDGARVVSRVRGALTTTRKLRSVVSGSIALVGDASGSADAITGEGIALSFRQALSLAESVAADDLSIYQGRHSAIMRMPHMMSRAMLALDARPSLRDYAMGRLAAQPKSFGRLLALHLGEQSMGGFLGELPALSLGLLWPTATIPTRIF